MSHIRLIWAVAVATAPLVAAVCPAQTLTLGQVDTFTGGTTQNWAQGANAPAGALTVMAGGPGGAADNFLQIQAGGGFGAGSRLLAFNSTQWAGNYPAAGVNAIQMDLRGAASNAQPLSVRIAFRDGTGRGYSSAAVAVPNDGTWRPATFLLDAAVFTPINSPATPFNTFIASAPELRILHAAGPGVAGDPIAATLGVDNIRASPVPEPGSAFLVGAGTCGLAAFVRRVRRANTNRPAR